MKPEMIDEWIKAKANLDKAKKLEKQWRDHILGELFKNPKEGTNTTSLGPYTLKAVFPLDRDIDIASLTANADRYRQMQINLDDLIRTKYELAVAEYRKLNEEQIKAVDESLIIKPGSASLKAVRDE